jgi:DNA-binding LytR/AlgR family response regulator
MKKRILTFVKALFIFGARKARRPPIEISIRDNKKIITIELPANIEKFAEGDILHIEGEIDIPLNLLRETENVNQQTDRLKSKDTRLGFDILFTDILYCQANESYTDVHLLNGRTYNISKNLKHICSLLSADFIRIHRSYVVHSEQVKQVFKIKRLFMARLNDGTVLNVSPKKGILLFNDPKYNPKMTPS